MIEFYSIVLKRVCFGIGGSLYPSENAILRITQCIRETERLKKPMQVAGCVVSDCLYDHVKLSELKIGSSVYAKKKKETNWICVCLDRNQLLSKHISSYSYNDCVEM